MTDLDKQAMVPSQDNIPYGYCQCGCGQKTAIAKRANGKLGHIKGQPVRFSLGHYHGHPRSPRKIIVADGFCQCGCGQKTNFPKQNDSSAGLRLDIPRRFIVGHNAFAKRPPDEHILIDGQPCVRIALLRGYFTIIDLADYELASRFKWTARVHQREDGLARNIYAIYRTHEGEIVSLHRFLLGVVAQPDILVDHKDGDGLNNRRSNLRVCQYHQNSANQRLAVNNTSGFKGVSWDKQSGKWKAYIGVKGKLYNLGRFADIRDAARTYNAAAIERFGEFANLNVL